MVASADTMTPGAILGGSVADVANHACSVRDLAGLQAICDGAINLAIWHRGLGGPPIVSDILDLIDDIAVELDVDRLVSDLPALLADAGYPKRSIAPLATDVAQLGARLAAIFDAPRIAVRLEVICTDACRRFHADYNTARLLCTYVGPGTQWLDNDDAVSLAAGADATALTIRQIATGDVAVMKGRRLAPDRPLIHRSPPVSATGEQRLVLVIDPPPDAAVRHA